MGKTNATRVVIVQLIRHWTIVGIVEDEHDNGTLYLQRAAVIRTWGTTEGLGQLVNGPTGQTVYWKIPSRTRVNPTHVLFCVEVSAEKWAGHLQ